MDTSVYVKSFITSTHYQHITVLPKDTPFTCSSAEIHFNVLNLMLDAKQICLKQLKSITSQSLLNGTLYISFPPADWKTRAALHVQHCFKLSIRHKLIKT